MLTLHSMCGFSVEFLPFYFTVMRTANTDMYLLDTCANAKILYFFFVRLCTLKVGKNAL